MTAVLLNGTMGCGSICAVDSARNLLGLGDGENSDVLKYDGQTATLIPPAEVNYGKM